MPNNSTSDITPLETRPTSLRMTTSPSVQQKEQQPASWDIIHEIRPSRPRSQSSSHTPKDLSPRDIQVNDSEQKSTIGIFTSSLYEKALRPPLQAVMLLLQIGIRIATAEVDPAQLEKYSSQIKTPNSDEDCDFGIPLPLRQCEDDWRRVSPGDNKALSSVD
ncbi:hypothetical protein KEM54_004770 [Ascosphaera aggregata]|nr:hypothetical protein KEM54_004770 [Ascosphaera aggregata]